MDEKLLNKIKTRGYWRINFQPLTASEKLESMKACREILEKNSVHLRGWDYPHIPNNDQHGVIERCGSYLQATEDWMNFLEYWRIYKSGQFIHYLALHEDWIELDGFHGSRDKNIAPMTVLGVVGSTTYQVTEIFEFLSRLTRAGIYEEGVKVSIGLHNIKGRELWIDDFNRVPLMSPRRTGAQSFEYEEILTREQVITKSNDIALKVILNIFDIFGWEDPPVETVKNDQKKLLAGTL